MQTQLLDVFNPLRSPDFKAMKIIFSRVWTEKVPLYKKSRRKINYRYLNPLRSSGVQRHILFPKSSMGGGQNLERRNVERLIYRNFKITNIKITKDELFDSFIFDFIFSLFINYLHN